MQNSMRRVLAAALMTLAVSVVGPAHADTERRVALIIGNDSYRSMKTLDNAVNDARAMDRELKAAGFETTLRTNASRKEINGAINEFADRLASGAVGLFYYAGHGIESKGQNFLVPVEAELTTERDLEDNAVDAGKVLRAMKDSGNKLNIVILDACRDNPLKSRSGSRGLAVIPSGGAGLFVAYAAGPGEKAEDGAKGGNGIFTGELVKALREPGLKIEDVFKKVSAGVQERTGGRQVPYMTASIKGDFYFRPGSAAAPVVRNDGSGGGTNEGLFWQSIKDSRDASDFDAYLKRYPNGDFADLARSRMDKLKGTQTAALVPPRPDPVLDALDREMVAGRKASVRDAPEAKAKVVSSLTEGDAVQVTGKVRGANWYAVSRKGQSGYVVPDTLEDPTAYKARKEKETQAASEEAKRRQQAEGEEAKRHQQVAVLAPPPSTQGGGESRSPGSVFRDCPDCPEMVVVPAGSFTMGSNDGLYQEKPVHPVSIARPFAVGRYEVMRGEYAVFVRETGHPSGDGCYVSGHARRREANWQSPGFSQSERDPVVCVSWQDAQAFVSWLNAKVRSMVQVSTGGSGPYRLPTEAEWEYAARAGTTTNWSCGDHEGCLSSMAIYSANSGSRTAPVGGRSANAFGFHDMHGNVREWVDDCATDSNYDEAPSNGSAVSKQVCYRRVLRGGSWGSDPMGLRSAYRFGTATSVQETFNGFRLARTLP
jgi:formylglycine-generating enzyme required for sulfatase activity